MGQRASDTRGITFEDVRVPKEVGLSTICWKTQLCYVQSVIDVAYWDCRTK